MLVKSEAGNRLSRARQFLIGKLRSSTLKVIALGVLVIGSLTAATTDVSVLGPTFGPGTGDISSEVISNSAGSGVKFWGTADPSCGGAGCFLQFDFTATNNLPGGNEVQFSWLFSISSFLGSSGSGINWLLTDANSNTIGGGFTAGGPSASFSGSQLIPEGLVRFSAQSADDQFSVDIPKNSLDFLPTATAAVPEPGSFIFVFAGAAALVLLKRRRE